MVIVRISPWLGVGRVNVTPLKEILKLVNRQADFANYRSQCSFCNFSMIRHTVTRL